MDEFPLTPEERADLDAMSLSERLRRAAKMEGNDWFLEAAQMAESLEREVANLRRQLAPRNNWVKPFPDCEITADVPRRHRCGKTVARCQPCANRMLRERDERRERSLQRKLKS